MTFDQLIEYNVGNIFLEKSFKNEAGKIVKASGQSQKAKASGQHPSFNIFW